MSKSIYKMTVDLNVLEHLGINLYSNISAVLTEAVANAWDADATEVTIDIDLDENHDTVRISDNGIGMTVADVNEKYLHIGYRRRMAEKDVTASGRPVMGRKGLGKLSLFSLADIVEVQSAKDGERHGLVLNVEDMRMVCRKHAEAYVPKPLPKKDVSVVKGTCITLHKIKRPRLAQSMDALRMLLARRFSVIGEKWGFHVILNGRAITMDDRRELKAAQFLWIIGDAIISEPSGSSIQERFKMPSDGTEMGPRGWIATVGKPSELEVHGTNLNGIVVLSRGRLIQEDIFSRFHDGRIYTKYVTGQINYDLLDDTRAGDDVATSDRQRIKEDDPRYLKLLEFLKGALTQVEAQWNEFRPRHEIKNALEKYPALADWIGGLKPGTRKTAEKMVAKVASIPVDYEDDRKTLLKHSVYAFERMELRGSEGEFVQGVVQIDRLLELLADRDVYEAELYVDIVRSRLEAIRHISTLVDADKKEKILQEYLFEHLWLLDPTWERATGSERIEQSLKQEYRDFADDLTEEESKGRVDIRYKTSAGSHIIVELKRYGRLMTLPELLDQGEKYRSALFKCLSRQGKTTPDIQIVFVLGRPVVEQGNPAFGPEYVKSALQKLNARVVYYDEMIANAQKAYSEYSEKEKKISRLDKVLKEL